MLDDGGIRGYALLLRHARMASWRLYSLVVDPRCRGTGLGARLLADAERLAGEAGAAALTLEVREDNAAAIALYRRHGWQDAGRIAAYYDDGCAALRLRRELPGATGRSRMAD